MKRNAIILTAAVLGLGALAATATIAHNLGHRHGHGITWGQSQGYGHGEMRDHGQQRGYGQGYRHDRGRNGCQDGQALEKPLTADDVRASLEQQLKRHGNDRLKVGQVIETDDKVITAEIVTVDDSLVRKIQIDKATGRRIPVN